MVGLRELEDTLLKIKKWTDELYTRLRFYSFFVFPTFLVARLDKMFENLKYWADGMDTSTTPVAF